MDKNDIERAEKHSKSFYFGIVVFLIMGFVSFSIFMNTFSKTGKAVSIPLAFPIMAIIIFYEGVVKGRGLGEVGVKRENFWRNVVIGALLAFFVFTMFGIANLIIPGLMEEVGSRPETVSNFFRFSFPFPLNYILQTVYVFALLAPAEEVLFRGFIQGKLQKWMSVHLAIIVQSILFGLAHAIPAYAMGLSTIYSLGYGLIGFFGGMLYGIAFYKTGNNIVAPWIAHAISDSPLILLTLRTS